VLSQHQESSHKRHISYCRRNQTRPRTRPRSCRSCNLAKVKCTFQTPCQRCSTKGLGCIYELSTRTITGAESGQSASSSAQGQNGHDLLHLQGSIQRYGTSNTAIEEDLQATDAFDFLNSTGDTEDMELLQPSADDSPVYAYDGTREISTLPAVLSASEPVPFGAWAWPHASIQPDMGHTAQAPWSTWINSVANQSAVYSPNLSDILSFPQKECLVLLRPSSILVQNNIRLVVQALRAYPLMMLRRETFPPFIHPHWCRQSSPVLPEPLSNCMSIAQMFASRSDETKPFLWRTIKAEDERVLTQVTDSCSYTVLILIYFLLA